MNNKEFDDIIKNKLKSLNTDGTEDAWDLFKEKWDNEPNLDQNVDEQLSSEDQYLDDKIKTNMQKLRIPFNSAHWIILKEQLELEALFKKKLFVAKSAELVILAFLVVGMLNLWPIQNDIHQILIYNSPMVASIPVDIETAKKYEAQEEVRSAIQSEFNQQIFGTTKKLIQKTVHSIERLSIYPLQSSSEKQLIKKSIRSINSVEGVPENGINTSNIQFPFLSTSGHLTHNGPSENQMTLSNDDNSVAQLLQKEISTLEAPKRPIGFPDIILNHNLKKEENTYFSIAVGPKMNMINSPFDLVYEIDPYNIINTNFNVSAKVNKEIGPLEMFVGLGYTNTSYIPRIVDETYESQEQQFNKARLENIKFKTFSIPLGVRYNLIDSKKYQLYTAAAVEMNIIADSEYIIQDIPADNRSQPAGPPSAPTKINEANINSKLSQKDFNKGIFSGGSLKDNLYTTASIGLGLNWNFTSRSGIFIEPRYAHFISSKGIGPNADKVHSLSLDLGFRYQLN